MGGSTAAAPIGGGKAGGPPASPHATGRTGPTAASARALPFATPFALPTGLTAAFHFALPSGFATAGGRGERETPFESGYPAGAVKIGTRTPQLNKLHSTHLLPAALHSYFRSFHSFIACRPQCLQHEENIRPLITGIAILPP